MGRCIQPYFYKYLTLLVVLPVLVSCASLAGRQQVIAIDSPEHGLQVRSEDGQLLGTTPLFAPVKRQRHQVLRVGTRGQNVAILCDYRPLSSMLPNAVLASLATQAGLLPMAALFALGNGTDLLTGAAFDCPDAVVLPAESTEIASDTPPSCRTLLVAPPLHHDPGVSRDLAERWWQQHHHEFRCDCRVDPDQAEALLRRQGISNERGLDPPNHRRQLLNQLGWRSGATHVAVLETKLDGDAVLITPALWSLFSLQKQLDDPMAFDLQLRRQPRWRRALAWLGRHMSVLPDSVGYAPTGKTFDFIGVDGHQVAGVTLTPSSVPALLGNWSLLSVEHPGAFRPWDLSWDLGPRVLLGYGAVDVQVVAAKEVFRRSVRLLDLGGLYGATGTAHTPVGALSLFAGLGWAPTWHWAQGHYVGFAAPVVASVSAAYTAFATENLFLRAEASSFESQSPSARGDGYGLWRWTTVSFTLGWYAPEWRSRLRSLW